MTLAASSSESVQTARFSLRYDEREGGAVADKLTQFSQGLSGLTFFCKHCTTRVRGTHGPLEQRKFKEHKTAHGVLGHIRGEHTGTKEVKQQNVVMGSMRVNIIVNPADPSKIFYFLTEDGTPSSDLAASNKKGAATDSEDVGDREMLVPEPSALDHSPMEGVTSAARLPSRVGARYALTLFDLRFPPISTYFGQKPETWNYVCALCLPLEARNNLNENAISSRQMSMQNARAHICCSHLTGGKTVAEVYENTRLQTTCLLFLSEQELVFT